MMAAPTTPIVIPTPDLTAVGPELVLAVGGLLLLIFGSLLGRRGHGVLAAASLVVIAGAGIAMIPAAGKVSRAFDDAIAADGFAFFFKAMLLTGAALSIIVSINFVRSERVQAAEAYGLMIFATAGMMLMASATDLMLIFLALEIFSLALYVLVAFRRRRSDSQEGALKYFLMGSFSSAFFLYGAALAYGATGSTRLIDIAQAANASIFINAGLLTAGLALLLVGLAFKVAAVPFHMWTPDAYQGAPSPITGFMAAGSKAAGFAVLLRLLVAVVPALVWDWRPVVSVLAVVSMIVGSIVALSQTNVKRLLAYSAIAHSGFLLIGVVSANSRGVSGSLFYLAVYGFTIIGAFAVIYAVAGPGDERVDLSDYRGLGERQPFLAGALALLLFSLAGLPPTAGFWAKFEVFSAAIDAGQTPLVVVAVLASAVAAFFYVRIIWLMFFDRSEEWEIASERSTAPSLGFVVITVCVVVLLIGVQPSPLLEFARQAGFVFR